MWESFREYITPLGRWGWVVLVDILAGATGAYLDISGKREFPTLVWLSLLGIGLLIVPFVVFHKVRVERDKCKNQLDKIKNSRPNISFDSLSPEAGPPWVSDADNKLRPIGCYLRLAFKNIVDIPSGDVSTAKGTTAKIGILTKDNSSVDSWDGRWAKTNPPESYEDILMKNRLDIPANEIAILDIGVRIKGKLQFQGHDNRHDSYPQPPRRLVEPGSYRIRVELRASNMIMREDWFTLDIPDEPQTDNLNQVVIKHIQSETSDS